MYIRIHPILFIQDIEGSVDDLSEDELGCLDDNNLGSIHRPPSATEADFLDKVGIKAGGMFRIWP